MSLQSESSARVVNTLLTELDGLSPRKQVFVIGATNRPDILDPAMVRPGRLDKLLYVDLPTPSERIEILRALTKKTPLSKDVNLELIGKDPGCDGLSGADLGALVREAAVSALREVFASSSINSNLDEEDEVEGEEGREKELEVTGPVVVQMRHFVEAIKRTPPSVSVAQRRRFALLRAKFAGQPVGHAKEGSGEGGKEEEASKAHGDT